MSKGAAIFGTIAGFVLGATAGAIGAGYYFKRKYKAIADAEVASVVEAFSHTEERETKPGNTPEGMTVEQAFKKASEQTGMHSVSSVQQPDPDEDQVAKRAVMAEAYNSTPAGVATPTLDNPEANRVPNFALDDVPDDTPHRLEEGCAPFEIQAIEYMTDGYDGKDYRFYEGDGVICDDDGYKLSSEEIELFFGPHAKERIATGNGWTHFRCPKFEKDFRVERCEGRYDDSDDWREEAWSVR